MRFRNFSSHFSSFRSPNPNIFLYSIIGVNSLVFYGWHQARDDWKLRKFMRTNFTLSKSGVMKEYRLHTLLTATMSHQSLSHFLGNMVTLYFFGSTAVAVLGVPQFALLYFGGGVMSSFGQILADYYEQDIKKYNRWIFKSHLGASGGVMSVLTWTILSFPTNTIMLYFIIPMPAALFGVLYVAHDLYGLFEGQPDVSYFAHLVGAAYGTATFFLLKHRHKIFRRW
jgi:membrane associated rhomboid family serine protease